MGHRRKERRIALKFSELYCKEVICVADGRRLGYISDAQLELPEGRLLAIVVPGSTKLLGLLSPREDYVIPWRCVRRFGPDIVLVDVKPEECRVPRTRLGLPL